MPKVIQIRDVPDEVRDALAEAAASEGLSMSGYVRRELEQLAGRSQRVRENAAAIRRTQRRVGGAVDRDTILSVLHEGRGE
ncbi:MAG: FitA-like ribbon-helix-helix domain-containing protein [Sporichthyaceae bacterium]